MYGVFLGYFFYVKGYVVGEWCVICVDSMNKFCYGVVLF